MKTVSRKHGLATAVAAVLGTAVHTTAMAQVLEEVMVTAQKRTESAQDVPIAISSLSEQFILDTGIDNLTQAISLLPGVSGTTAGIGTNAWAIRGISTNDWSIGSEPSVAIYVDEAYVGRNVLATASFFDLASLEALKGPQGTLFGRNAVAGAITLTTNRPADENTLRLGGGVGNEGQRDYDIVANAALTDSFAIRAVYHGTRYEGLWKDVANGEDMFRDEDGFRLAARWDAADDLTALLTLNYGDQETNNGGAYNPQLSTVAPGEEFPDKVAWDAADNETNETRGANLRLEWQLNDSMAFTSITDFRHGEYNYLQDVDGSNNGPAVDALLGGVTGSISLDFEQVDTTVETFAQELRLSGSTASLDWFAGINYFREDVEDAQSVVLRNTLDAPEFGLTDGMELARDRNLLEGENESMGVFGDMRWNATDRLGITGGIRYTRDEKDFCTEGFAEIFLITVPSAGPVCDSSEREEVTPRFVVDYEIADTVMTYGSVSRGYKAGGYNPAPTDTNGDFVGDQATPFDPEESVSYELGLKSELMDRRLRLNLAAFYVTYDDIQVQTATLAGIVIDNAAEADISGGEIEATFAATANLTLSANYAHASGEYEDEGVYDGNQLIFAPEDTFSVNGKYTFQTAGGEWSAFALYTWQSEMYYTPLNSRELREPSYGLLSGRLAYVPNSGRWDVALSGDNLLDEEFAAVRQDIGLGSGVQINRGLPRRYMVSLNLYL